NAGRNEGNLPPPLPGAKPPIIGVGANAPAQTTASNGSGLAQGISGFLSFFLAVFLADGLVSVLDDSLILFFQAHLLSGIRGLLSGVTLLVAIGVYGLMALTPMVPKRWFLPLALFLPIAALATLPFLIYFRESVQAISWVVSLVQLLFGLTVLHRIRGGFKIDWPFVKEEQLAARRFSWRNLVGFVALNLFLLLPLAAGYLGTCAALAVDHFSAGFMALRPTGLKMEVRTYANEEGKTIQLYPMMHIGDAAFYRQLSESIPTNSVILMEGVSDRNNLLKTKAGYSRLAQSLGLADQKEEFVPEAAQVVNADVDVETFAPETIAVLNTVMQVHAKGLNADGLRVLMKSSPPAGFEEQFWEDILRNRNQHLLMKIEEWLPKADHLVVPWGAAHMPEIEREIAKAGFRLQETERMVAVRFGRR
ncbi:MAG: hypothetical protein ACK4UN_02130, partial [Limisphaerales bacterium]